MAGKHAGGWAGERAGGWAGRPVDEAFGALAGGEARRVVGVEHVRWWVVSKVGGGSDVDRVC